MRLLVLACETGSGWGQASLDFVRGLVCAKVSEAPPALRESLRQAWLARWWGLLSVAAQDALAASSVETGFALLDGADGPEPPPGDLLLDGGPTCGQPHALRARGLLDRGALYVSGSIWDGRDAAAVDRETRALPALEGLICGSERTAVAVSTAHMGLCIPHLYTIPTLQYSCVKKEHAQREFAISIGVLDSKRSVLHVSLVNYTF